MTDREDRVARLIRPSSVAIVGVSPEPGSLGGAVLHNLRKFGFKGDIHLVTRRNTEIDGLACVPTIDDLPDGVDAAVLAVPQVAAADAVTACGRRGIPAAVVFAAGFAETGDEGRAAQDALVKAAEDNNVLVFGPNCIGFVNFACGAALGYEPLEMQPFDTAPALGIAAQSGAMATALRLGLTSKGLAISHVYSCGNEAMLGIEDFIGPMLDDDRTRAVVIFAEQIRRPAEFLALARKAHAVGKPICMTHPGHSARAQETARSHTGAMAGDHALMSALVRREGVVLLETIEELCDTAEILVRFDQRPTGGTGIITNSGAFKGIAADLADSLGLDLPAPSPDGAKWIAEGLPPFATVENPLDVTGHSIKVPGILGHAARGLLKEKDVGSLLAAIIGGSGQGAIDKADVLLPAMTESPKPSVVAVFGDESPLPPEFGARFRDNGIPFYRSPERALRALARATAYGQSLEGLEARAEPRNLPPIDLPADGTLAEYKGKEIMASLGVAVPAGGLATDLDGAWAIAARIGYPVVIKAQAADLAHKSDVGGVIVGIKDEDALAAAWDKLHADVGAARPDLKLDGVLVEAMGPAGIEMIVGARRDPAWGPVTMVGLGGVWIEALKDVRLLAVDLTDDQIAAEIARLRGAALLAGHRGTPPADVAALAHTVGLVSALMAARPEIAEIDLNPVVVHPEGQGATALDVLIATEQ